VEPERGAGVVDGSDADCGHGLTDGRCRCAGVGGGHVERVDAARPGRHERHGRRARIVGGDEVVGVASRVGLCGLADVVDVTQLTGALEHAAARHQTTSGHVHRQHLHSEHIPRYVTVKMDRGGTRNFCLVSKNSRGLGEHGTPRHPDKVTGSA